MKKEIPKYYINEHHIVRRHEKTPHHIIGYDILTESFVKISMRSSFELPKSLMRLISDRKALILLDRDLSTNADQAYRLLGTTKRTFFRRLRELG